MATVIAVLSFLMAFGAIWFTTEVLKRVDSRNEAWLKPHLRKIHTAVNENHETLMSLRKRLDHLEKDIRILKLNAELPTAIEQESTAIQNGIDDLKRFTPTVQLNG